ncbi:hypothetical protein MTsPCn7_03210 [Altererythrobacter sp. MTPC7]
MGNPFCGAAAQEVAKDRPYGFNVAESVVGNFEVVAETSIEWRNDLPYPDKSHCAGWNDDIFFGMDSTGNLTSVSFNFIFEREEGDYYRLNGSDKVDIYVDGRRFEYYSVHQPDYFINVPETHPSPDTIQVTIFRGFDGVREDGVEPFYNITRIQQSLIEANKLEWELVEVEPGSHDDYPELGSKIGSRGTLDNASFQSAVNWCAEKMRSPARLTLPNSILGQMDK